MLMTKLKTLVCQLPVSCYVAKLGFHVCLLPPHFCKTIFGEFIFYYTVCPQKQGSLIRLQYWVKVPFFVDTVQVVDGSYAAGNSHGSSGSYAAGTAFLKSVDKVRETFKKIQQLGGEH